MPKTKLPIGIFAPDSEIIDSPSLEDCENLLPVYGSYQLLPQPQLVSTSGVTDTDPISGGHVHLLSKSQAKQIARPISDSSNATITAVVDQDGNSANTSDDTQGIYRSVDEAVPDDSDYIVSITTAADNAFVYAADFSALTDPVSSSDHTIRWRYKTSAAVVHGMTLYGVTDGLIASDSWTDSGDDVWTNREYTLSAGEANSITDYTDLHFIWRSDVINPTITAFDPDETLGNSGNWLGDDGGANIHTYVDDPADDTDYMVTPTMASGGSNFWCTLGLPDIVDPVTDDDHTIRIRARYATTDGATLKVRLLQDQTVITTHTFTLTGSFSTQTHALTTTEAGNITDYNQLKYVVQAANTGTTSGTVEVSALELDVPQSEQTSLSWVELEVPLPSSGEARDTDLNLQYVGTTDKLYEVSTDFDWDNVTRTSGGDYGQGADLPLSWDFASWGADLLATNFVDEIQVKTSTASDFANLISSPGSDEYEVRGRFIDVVNNFVVVADINPDSSGAGGSGTLGTAIGNPYTVWWSAINANDSFKVVDLSTQSDYQPLIDTPGAITGLVGGDYGIIFKRNSIYRMEYVGNDLFFTFDHISTSDGTAYPRSIVTAGSDVYFLGAGGIQVIRDGQVVQDVGDGQITRWLMDGQHNDEGLMQKADVDTRLVDSQIIGDYDPATRCVFWLYSPALTGKFNQERRLLVYNIKEDRFTKLSIDSYLPSLTPHYADHLMCLKNQVTNSGPITRLIQLYAHDPTNGLHRLLHFNDRNHASVSMVSSIISSEAITGSDQPINIQVNRIRPIFRLEGTTTAYPPISVLVESSNDPELRTSSSTTATYGDRDEDGWYPLPDPQSGEFFRLTTSIGVTPEQLKYFTHWQLDWEPLGEF